MGYGGVQAIELVFLLLLLFVIAFGELARRLQIPYPIVLVIAGALLGLVPGIPRVALNPDTIFFVILPPLLYSAAWTTSWREFSCNIVNILVLAIGLVFFTVAGVALAAEHLFAGFDAIAATSIADKIGLPRRIVDILEGESLVNDASGLLALEFGLAILLRGQTPTLAGGVVRMGYLILAGIGIGLAIGWIVHWIEQRIDDAPLEIALSILVPYAAYFTADRVRASGVLAVVTCGIFLSRKSSRFYSPGVRLRAWSVWESITFILNGLVFVLIGLQLPYVLAGIHGFRWSTLFLYGALFSALVIALRMIWAFPGAYLSYWIRVQFLHHRVSTPPRNGILFVGWTGMRGVIALAAAIALPQVMLDGSPFPQRNLIVFLAFCVILVTLVLQGLTLPWVVRVLGIAEKTGPNVEEERARREVLEAALTYMEEARRNDGSDSDEIYDDLMGHYQQKLFSLTQAGEEEPIGYRPEDHKQYFRISRQVLSAEREALARLRDEGRISDAVLRNLEYELDLREAGTKHVA
jgi:CPA1 family monovalent cation:H+ antiporter